MERVRFRNWLRNIYETRDEEISCTECFDRVSHYVDLETAGENAAAKMPQLRHHLDQCQACRDEYATLRDLARFENEGGAPSLESLQNSIR